jgi:NADH-quinone oxidoreductase subunit E
MFEVTQTESVSNVRKFEKVYHIMESFNFDKNNLIPILHRVQEEYRYLPEKIMTYIATVLDISPAKIYGVATFYSHFTLDPKGKYIIKVCNGTACHVKASLPIIDAIKKQLHLSDAKKTTDDMLFTLDTVSCLGACGLAPVVVINDDVHPMMTPDKITEVISSIKNSEENPDASKN